MTVRASALAAQALREYLLLSLPAQVTTLNLTRAATLTTPAAGPWTIPASGSISISLTGSTGHTACALTAGSRTAAQCATEINTAMGATVATALTDGRLRLTSTTAPLSPTTDSIIDLTTDATGASLALGWDPAGEMTVRHPIVAPTTKGVCDGEPQVMEPFAQGRMLVVIRDREDVAVTAELRREERLAQLEVLVYTPSPNQDAYHSSREEIQASVECITDILSSTAGRYMGRSADGDVMFAQVKSIKISGSAWQTPRQPNWLLDIARLIITCRVFQRPVL